VSCAVLLVGASADQAGALEKLLATLPALPVPLIVCAPSLLQIEHRFARDKELPEAGSIYLAPHGYDLLLDREGFALSADPQTADAGPSIDALFESAADVHGPSAAAVLLSQGQKDGASGLAALRAHGGRVRRSSGASSLGELAREVLLMVRSP
jgi:two-component system chemotaxis response regulator CheB